MQACISIHLSFFDSPLNIKFLLSAELMHLRSSKKKKKKKSEDKHNTL